MSKKKIIDFILGRSDEVEKPVELPESFKEFVRKERYYKLLAAFSFVAALILVGVPMWSLTTSVYKAPFPTISKDRLITIPIRVYLSSCDEETSNFIPELTLELERNLTQEVVSPIDLKFTFEYIGIKSLEELESDRTGVYDTDKINFYVALISRNQWPHFSATKVQLAKGNWNLVQWDERETTRVMSRVKELIWEVLIDVPHLNTIVKRDLRQRMAPWQIAALPLSHQKRLVWDSTPLALQYNVQVIHVHDNSSPDIKDTRKTSDALRKFAKLFSSVVAINVTSEHLWDFEISRKFVSKDVQERYVLSFDKLQELVKFVDTRTQTTLANGDVIRFVVIETENPVVIFDQMNEDTDGFAIASWGAVLSRNEETESKAIAAIRKLLGIDNELVSGWVRPNVPLCQWEITRAKLRASVDHVMRVACSIRALDEMKEKISNIVINDEVARKAEKAVRIVDEGMRGDKIPNYKKLVEARILADSASSDHSLLAFLYFPLDQRITVLLPISLPIVTPIIKLIYVIFKKTVFGNLF